MSLPNTVRYYKILQDTIRYLKTLKEIIRGVFHLLEAKATLKMFELEKLIECIKVGNQHKASFYRFTGH